MRRSYRWHASAVAASCVLCSAYAHADAGAKAAAAEARFGIGGAYLFGLAISLAIFALRRGIAARKSHLAHFGKQ